jgi:hypothetical protein
VLFWRQRLEGRLVILLGTDVLSKSMIERFAHGLKTSGGSKASELYEETRAIQSADVQATLN